MQICSAVGTRAFKCPAGQAGQPETAYTELKGFESIGGGGLNTDTHDYTPCTEGTTMFVPGKHSCSDITITSAVDVGGSSNLVDTLSKANEDREVFDLVKMVPRGETFKVYAWTVHGISDSPDESSANNLQKNTFTFKAYDPRVGTGSISGDTPTINLG